MALLYTLQQCIVNSTLNPKIRIRMNTYFGCNFISCFKPDTFDIIGKSVWIFFQNTINTKTILLINFHRKIDGNSIFLKIDHCLAKIFFLFNLCTDFSGLFFADSFHFCQPLRLFFHNPESFFSKLRNNLSSQCRPDSFHRPGSQISFNRLFVLRFFHLMIQYLKLKTVGWMHDIFALEFHKFPISNV